MAADYPILILDDSPTMARTMVLTLERAGYVVESREDLASALQRIAAQKLSAVVVDNNGEASWAAAVAEKTSVPIVALLDPTEGRAHLNGAFVAVQKPFETRALLEAVARAVRGRPKAASWWQRLGAWFKRLLGLDR